MNVTAKVTKSAGTATAGTPTPTNDKRGRTPVAPEQKTITPRGGERRYWSLLLAAFDGSADATATLFGNTPPVAPVKPILPVEDRSDNAKVLAHIDALETYSAEMEAYPAMVDAFNTRNAARNNLRTAIFNAVHDIPLRTRKGSDSDES